MLAVECRDRSAPILDVAIDIGDFGTQQTIRLHPDLMGRSIVELEGLRSSPDIDAQRFPGKRRLENPLSQITREKEAVRPLAAQRGKRNAVGRHRCPAPRPRLRSRTADSGDP